MRPLGLSGGFQYNPTVVELMIICRGVTQTPGKNDTMRFYCEIKYMPCEMAQLPQQASKPFSVDENSLVVEETKMHPSMHPQHGLVSPALPEGLPTGALAFLWLEENLGIGESMLFGQIICKEAQLDIPELQLSKLEFLLPLEP